MQRTESEWRAFAANLITAVDGCRSIGAINALEIHNDFVFTELKKASPKMHGYLIDYIDKHRIHLAQLVKKASVK